MIEIAKRALKTLLLPEYRAIHDIFADPLTKRSTQPESDCFIFRLVAYDQTDDLRILNKDCNVYISELGLEKAKQKCRDEILGVVKRPPREFNSRCGDFWAEMAAIRVLSIDGFHEFRPIAKNDQDGATNDYQAVFEESPAYVEVKNLRANETVVDIFNREIGRAYQNQPSAYPFHLIVDYAYDYSPTGEQERIIRDFIGGIARREAPFREMLNLVNGIATIDVTLGSGSAHLCRGVGEDSPEPINYEWLTRKVRSKAEEARAQIPDGSHMKVLLINVDTTTAMIDLEFIKRAKREIREVFKGDVHPYILHYRQSLERLTN